MKTKIFEHNGFVGIETGDTLINDPSAGGQLGTLVDLSEVEISPKAFDILLAVPKSGDAIGDVMCFGTTFGFMGYGNYFLHPEAEADRDYEPELLRACISDVEAPPEFREAVNVAMQIGNL